MRAARAIAAAGRTGRDAAAIWLALAAVYLLFAGTVSLNEGLAAVLCASLGTLWWWGAARQGEVRFRFGLGPVRPLAAALRGLPRQTARVGLRLARRVVARPAGGTVTERPASESDWAAAEGPQAPAARALGLIGASLAPDSYVLRLDRAHGTLAVHALDDSRP